jgi:hypothetical protein
MVFKFLALLLSFSIWASNGFETRSIYQLPNQSGVETNLIMNPSCLGHAEFIFTDSGGAVSRNTTDPLTDFGDCEISGTGVGSEVSFLGVQPSVYFRYVQGQRCEATIHYKGDASKWKFVMEAGQTAQREIQLTNTGTDTRIAFLSDDCEDINNPYEIKLIATDSTPATFNVIKATLGPTPKRGFGEIKQSFDFGSLTYAAASNCEWSTSSTSTTPPAFAADSDCATPTVTGYVEAPSTKIPAFVIPAGSPSGTYNIEAIGHFATSRNAASSNSVFFVYDGSSYSNAQFVGISSEGSTSAGNRTPSLLATYRYTSKSTDTLLEIRGYASTSGSSPLTIVRAVENDLAFNVTYLPDSSQIVVRGDVSDLTGFAKSPATADCNWSTTSATMASFAADADCPALTTGGNAASPATKIPAFVAPNLLPGKYQVVAFGLMGGDQSTSGTQGCNFEIWDGTSSGGAQRSATQANTGTSYITSLTGSFEYSAKQSDVTFQIRAQRTGGNASCVVSGASVDLSFTLIPLSQGLPRPFIPGSVYNSTEVKNDLNGVTTIETGTYTPTLTGVSNVTSVTLTDAKYTRIGKRVRVAIRVTLNPTSASGAVEFNTSLPVAKGSNFSATGEAHGGGISVTSGGSQFASIVSSNVGAQTVFLRRAEGTSSSITHNYWFEYDID